MTGIVSLDDFLGSFDFSGKSYSARDVYDAYCDFESGNYMSLVGLERDYNLGVGICYGWKNNKSVPFCVKHVRALECLNLLPLSDYSKNFQFFKELFLHTLLSGSIMQNSADSYVFELCGGCGVDLGAVGVKVSEITGLNHKTSQSGNMRFSSKEESLSPALSRLMYLAGIPLGDKKDWMVNVPDWVDADFFLYYSYKLKSNYSGDRLNSFNLWTTDEVNAVKSADNVLAYLKKNKTPFSFSYNLENAGGNSVQGSKLPIFTIDFSQQSFLELFLRTFKPVLPV